MVFDGLAIFSLGWYNKDMMKQMKTDLHTHTKFSPDGKDDIETMLAAAEKQGVSIYGISEHIDYDMRFQGICVYEKPFFTDEEAYFRAAREKQKEFAGRVKVLVGAEFGYEDGEAVAKAYRNFYQKYKPDFIINSVHTVKGKDYCNGKPYRTENGQIRPKSEVYGEYFALIKRSVEAEYYYDIVGHLGYCARYAPYEDKSASYEEFPEEWDSVLKAVVERDKILEVNSSNKQGVSPTLPNRDILERYYALGGRKISFGSDAHFKERIADKREFVLSMLKGIGFTVLTVPDGGKRIEVEI